MRTKMIIAGCVLILALVCGKSISQTNKWPYSDAYRGLTPLSEEGAKRRAIGECEHRLGTSNDVAILALPVKEQGDYFRVLVQGRLNGVTVTNSVLIHRFNAKGDKIEK